MKNETPLFIINEIIIMHPLYVTFRESLLYILRFNANETYRWWIIHLCNEPDKEAWEIMIDNSWHSMTDITIKQTG